MKHPLTLFALLLAPLAVSPAAEPGQPGRIAVRDGRFVDSGTGRHFRPLGVNYHRLGPVDEKKQGHAAFSPGSCDEAFITCMMESLSRDGFNTVRSFLSNHSGANGIVTQGR